MAKGGKPPDISDQEIIGDIFKYCIADHDNTGANCMVDERGKLYVNDNGNAFSRGNLFFSNRQLGKNIPPSAVGAFRTFIGSLPGVL